MVWKEEDIIAGCIKKKRKAQKALYEKYHRAMAGICLRYCNHKDEAEDVLTDGFYNVFTKIETFAGKGSFTAWMKRVFVNTAIDNYRKNLKHYHHLEIGEVKDNLSEDEDIPQNVAVEELMKTVNSLPPGYRMVFNLYAIEGYSHKEIGEMLGVSENTSKTQLMKARKWLQKQLALSYEGRMVIKGSE
ncbi:MAG: sigma-70 family RNA polymerase sigma factor [Bacteroidales bacterium]|nr:sigma-70 family RNA polymerase sigma factor [Bacteroidales bacterium]